MALSSHQSAPPWKRRAVPLSLIEPREPSYWAVVVAYSCLARWWSGASPFGGGFAQRSGFSSWPVRQRGVPGQLARAPRASSACLACSGVFFEQRRRRHEDAEPEEAQPAEHVGPG